MAFGAANLVFLLLLVPLLAAVYLWGFRRRRQALAAFVAAALAPRLVGGFSWRRRAAKAASLVAAVGFLGIAIMEPQWGRDLADTSRRGRDIFILLDVSRSMLAEDAQPSRLGAAKAGIADFVEAMRKVGGNRLGLVTFAGRASLQSPLTLDYDFFLNRLALVTTESVDRRGSAIGDAVRKTLYGFGAIDPTYTDIILVSDGEDHGSGPIDGGAYVAARTRPLELEALFVEHIADKAQRELEASASEAMVHRYHWFVLLALAMLAAEMLIRERPMAGEES